MQMPANKHHCPVDVTSDQPYTLGALHQISLSWRRAKLKDLLYALAYFVHFCLWQVVTRKPVGCNPNVDIRWKLVINHQHLILISIVRAVLQRRRNRGRGDVGAAPPPRFGARWGCPQFFERENQWQPLASENRFWNFKYQNQNF